MTDAAVEDDDALHARLVGVADTILRSGSHSGPRGHEASRLRNGVSSHNFADTVSFPVLDAFVTRVAQTTPQRRDPLRCYMGSIDGHLVVSVRVRPPSSSLAAEPTARRKRGRDDCGDRAETTVSKLRTTLRTTQPGNTAALAQLTNAKDTVERLLRNVRGTDGEDPFESCAISFAQSQQQQASTAAASSTTRPRLIVACRLSAGVALSLSALRDALGACFRDGMITTKPESLGAAYQLPLRATGHVVEESGQRSMLLFAAVPDAV